MVVGACNPSYPGRWGRIAWTQKVKVAVSQDHAIVLQPGWQEQTSVSKNKTKQDILKMYIAQSQPWATTFNHQKILPNEKIYLKEQITLNQELISSQAIWDFIEKISILTLYPVSDLSE